MGQPEYLVGGILLLLAAVWLWDDDVIKPEKEAAIKPEPERQRPELINQPIPRPPVSGPVSTPVWFWQQSREERILSHKWKTKQPWAKLAREIMWFTGSVLRENKITHYPDITLRYYKHSRWAGVYYGGTQEIVVYLKNHSTIREFVDTVLHEVCHHIQNKGNNREYRKYSEYNSRYGYQDNPLEVESRQFAKDHTVACLAYLENKQLIY